MVSERSVKGTMGRKNLVTKARPRLETDKDIKVLSGQKGRSGPALNRLTTYYADKFAWLLSGRSGPASPEQDLFLEHKPKVHLVTYIILY